MQDTPRNVAIHTHGSKLSGCTTRVSRVNTVARESCPPRFKRRSASVGRIALIRAVSSMLIASCTFYSVQKHSFAQNKSKSRQKGESAGRSFLCTCLSSYLIRSDVLFCRFARYLLAKAQNQACPDWLIRYPTRSPFDLHTGAEVSLALCVVASTTLFLLF